MNPEKQNESVENKELMAAARTALEAQSANLQEAVEAIEFPNVDELQRVMEGVILPDDSLVEKALKQSM